MEIRVINYNEIDRLTDYQNYDLLTKDDMVELFKLVLLFNPKIFIDAGIFIIDESLLPYDLDNQFYKITDERIGIYVNDEIMIGGRNVKVLNVMVCNEDWLVRNYYRPWKNLFELYESFTVFNEKSDKDYNITVSAGACVMDKDAGLSLSQAMTIADEDLYKVKALRSKNVIKEKLR